MYADIILNEAKGLQNKDANRRKINRFANNEIEIAAPSVTMV